jgi:LuxR family maltose regulon positive regulatory protein
MSAVAACAAFAGGDTGAGDRHLEQAVAAGADTRDRALDAVTIAELCAARAKADFERAVAAAVRVLEHADNASRRAFAQACVGVAALWSHRLDRAVRDLGEAVALARDAGLDHLAVAALGHLSLCDALHANAGGVLRHAREALALADDRGFSGGAQTATAHLALALLALSEMRPHEAEERLACARSARVPSRGFDLLLAHSEAELQELRGCPAEGLRVLDRFDATSGNATPVPYEHAAVGALRARLHAALGDLGGAQRVLTTVAGEPWLMVPVVRAQLLLAQGDPGAALEALESPLERTLLERTRVEQAVVRAVALERAQQSARAGETFETALGLAEPQGHRWTFLILGRRVESLLRDRIRHGTRHRAFVGELLDALANPDRPRTTIPAVLEPLTDRELAVLRFLPTRLSNPEIAAELFISSNTVKTHLRNIYRKLDVERRNEAVARARALNLLTASVR